MKKLFFLHITLCTVGLFTLKSAYGQTAGIDTNLLQASLNSATSVYNKKVGVQLPLYNGPEYYFYNPLEIKGSAYFQDATFATGDVYYDGAGYKGVQLLYDLYKDQLIAILFDHYSKYVLIKNLVQNFDLLGHHFISINADTLTKNELIKTGYYDELYHGKSQVLSKRNKTIQSYTSSTGASEAYSLFSKTNEDFFIRKDNIYYKADSQGELLSVLKDKKKLLQQYIESNKIKFNKDRESALVSIVSYYDHLSN